MQVVSYQPELLKLGFPARKITRDRVNAGFTQRELAKRAGIAVEHLCRIETGKHTPTVPTIDKIDRALKRAGKGRKK